MSENDAFKTKDGDKVSIHADEDYSGVTWWGLCGYSMVTFETTNAEDARKLFDALRLITGYEVN